MSGESLTFTGDFKKSRLCFLSSLVVTPPCHAWLTPLVVALTAKPEPFHNLAIQLTPPAATRCGLLWKQYPPCFLSSMIGNISNCKRFQGDRRLDRSAVPLALNGKYVLALPNRPPDDFPQQHAVYALSGGVN